MSLLSLISNTLINCMRHIHQKTTKFNSMIIYAVKAQTSLAPLSWFPGSRIPTAHVHQCCRFQSYANSHAIAYEIYKRNVQSVNRIPGPDPRQRTTWSRPVTFDFNSVLTQTEDFIKRTLSYTVWHLLLPALQSQENSAEWNPRPWWYTPCPTGSSPPLRISCKSTSVYTHLLPVT